MSEAFSVRESAVADELGLPVKTVRSLREQHLTEDDYRKEGAAMMYRPEAVAKLREALGLASTPPAAAAPELEKDAPCARLEATVFKFFHNPRIIGIRIGETEARLRVRDSKNFTKGMVCPVRLVAEPDLYELSCRAPRWRGKF